MKRNLMALAVMTVAGAASAQSSVTLSGIVDNGLTRGTGSISKRLQLTSGSNSTSRLIFRGTEDLGGGMSGSFWLEAGLNTDDGSGQVTNTNNQSNGQSTASAGTQGLTFNRRSTVSLASPLGELRLGRDFVPQYWNRSAFDPFGAVGVGQVVIHNLPITGVTSVRASNSVGYFLPARLGGVYGQAMYYMGENANNVATDRDGSGYGVRLGYQSGPFNVAAATGRTRYVAGNVRQSNVGGSWDFGVAKLIAQYEAESSGNDKAKGWLVGGHVPVGAGQIRLSYSRMTIDPASASTDRVSSKTALGYVHNLSKRTAVYGTFARVSNSGGASLALGGATTAANSSSNGFDLGVRHSF